MRKISFVLLFLAFIFAPITSAEAQLSVSIYGGGVKSVSSGFEHYFGESARIGGHSVEFSAGAATGVKVAYHMGGFRAEFRADYSKGVPGSDPGFFSLDGMNCIMNIFHGKDCEHSSPSTKLQVASVSALAIVEMRPFGVRMYGGVGPTLRHSVLEFNPGSHRTSSTNLGITGAVGTTLPLGRRFSTFVEYGVTMARADFRTQNVPEALFVDHVRVPTVDHRMSIGMTYRFR